MESLAETIAKAVEKQQANNDKRLMAILRRVRKLAGDVSSLEVDLGTFLANTTGAMVQFHGAPQVKKPRAAISVSPHDVSNVLEDLRKANAPVALADIVAPLLTNRRKAAALRQLAAEGKVQQVKGGKWQAVAPAAEENPADVE